MVLHTICLYMWKDKNDIETDNLMKRRVIRTLGAIAGDGFCTD